jgi:hypothetical protein
MSGRTGYLGNSGAAVTKNHRAYPLRVGSELAGPNCRQSGHLWPFNNDVARTMECRLHSDSGPSPDPHPGGSSAGGGHTVRRPRLPFVAERFTNLAPPSNVGFTQPSTPNRRRRRDHGAARGTHLQQCAGAGPRAGGAPQGGARLLPRSAGAPRARARNRAVPPLRRPVELRAGGRRGLCRHAHTPCAQRT